MTSDAWASTDHDPLCPVPGRTTSWAGGGRRLWTTHAFSVTHIPGSPHTADHDWVGGQVALVVPVVLNRGPR